jgi:hypothetical protein
MTTPNAGNPRWGMMIFSGAPTASDLAAAPVVGGGGGGGERKRRRLAPPTHVSPADLLQQVATAEAETVHRLALDGLEASRHFPRRGVMRSQLGGEAVKRSPGGSSSSVYEFPSSEPSGARLRPSPTTLPQTASAASGAPHLLESIDFPVTSSESGAGPAAAHESAGTSSESVPLPLDTPTDYSDQHRWRGSTQGSAVPQQLGASPHLPGTESASLELGGSAPASALTAESAAAAPPTVEWDSWSPRGSTAVRACAAMREGCEVRAVTAAVLQVHPVQTVGERGSTLRTIHIGDPSRQNFEVTVWGPTAPKWALGDVVLISRLQIKAYRGRTYGSVFSTERIVLQEGGAVTAGRSPTDRARDIADLKQWRGERYPWLEHGGETRVAYTTTDGFVEGYVIHFRGVATRPPRRVDDRQWCLEVAEGRLVVTVVIFGMQHMFVQLQAAMPHVEPVHVDLRHFFVASARGSSTLQLVTIEGESTVAIAKMEPARSLPTIVEVERKGSGAHVVAPVTVTSIVFSGPVLTASRAPTAGDTQVVWTAGSGQLVDSPENAIRTQLHQGCIGCAARSDVVGGIVQICQRRSCSLGSGRVFHRLCIDPVVVIIEDGCGHATKLAVQYGTGPSHKTLAFLVPDNGKERAPTADELCDAVIRSCTRLLTETSAAHVTVHQAAHAVYGSMINKPQPPSVVVLDKVVPLPL